MKNTKKQYLIALPSFSSDKSFNNETILVRAKNEIEALEIAMYLKPGKKIGSIKEVNYN